ncbi:MAG: hypothetical protein N2114_06370, partial [Candidatus Goldbacteria bacterium]|nr:hypothetical protein [Candidatus Goldiibacteriota bacterium]
MNKNNDLKRFTDEKLITSILLSFIIIFIICPVYALDSNDIIAYDPIDNIFVYKNRGNNFDGFILENLKNMKYKKLKNRETKEFYLDGNIAKKIASHKGLDFESHKKAKIIIRKLKDDVYRLELNNKLDGYWYRLKLKIPDGYSVRKILRDDGVAIGNIVQIDRASGKTIKEDIRWYVEDNTLYFYDDPISGYSVILSPPQPWFSIMVEEALNSAGQISSIVYPYNGEQDLIAGINNLDHIGRIGDNGIGQDIDGDAGSKIALR